MSSDYPFPSESESQRIGQNAKKAFNALMPLSWRATELSGDEDVGLDYHVQGVMDGQYRYAFHIQIKGSESPTMLASQKHLAVQLKAKTINYYQNVTEPVMLAFFDLSNQEDPRMAKGYYVWIHDELQKLTGDSEYVDDTQKTHTVHVPIESKFDRNLDVSEYCLKMVRQTHASKGIVDAISSIESEDNSLETSASAKKLSTRIRKGGRPFLNSVLADSSTPWVEAPEDSIAGKLRSATENLKLGRDGSSEELLKECTRELANASLHEQAEYHYLTGSVSSIRGDSQQAAICYKRAHRLYEDEPKYIVAWIQEKIRTLQSDSYRRNFARLIALLPSSNRREVVCLKSKLLAGLGKYGDAIDVLKLLPQERRYVSTALIDTLRENWVSVRRVCEVGLSDASLPAKHRAILHILKGRAIFQILLEDFQDGSKEMWVPLTGPAGVDPKLLNECWLECYSAIKLLRRDGWPLDIEHLAEYLPIPAVALSKHRKILEDVREAATRRPHLVALQACLERLALVSGNIPVALEAMDRQPQSGELDRHKAYICWEDGQNGRALEIAWSQVDVEGPEVDRLDPQLLVIGAVAAHELLESVKEAKCVELLESNSNWTGELAVYTFLTETADSPLKRNNAIKELLHSFESNKDCELLQGTLLRQLRTGEPEEARHFIMLSDRIRSNRELELRDIVRLAKAHFTLENWEELNELADDALERFGDREELVSIKALVLECRGESGAALDMLKPLIRRAKHMPLAVDVYTNIAIRCGFIDDAISIATRLLQREDDVDARRELLRLLFILKMMSSKPSKEVFEIAWRYGQLALQDDEVQEGIFLQLFLISTLDTNLEVDDGLRSEFQERLNKYCFRFPESKILRSIVFPKSDDPSSILDQLKRISGYDEERTKQLTKLVNDLHNQRIGIPFEWRPRNIFVNVGNLFHLWEISKKSDRDAKEFHLMMFADLSPLRRDLRKVQGVPLLDLVSLIVIDDLDLWEVLFKVFSRIAVAKSTLVELQNLCVEMFGLGFSANAKNIVEKLRGRVNSILQPGAIRTRAIGERTDLMENIDEVLLLVSTKQFICFSDDVCIRSCISSKVNGEVSICTYDLLIEAEARGYLSTRDVALRIAKLAKWNVGGVPVSTEHFLSVFPQEVDTTVNPEEIGEIIRLSTFAGMVEGLWDLRTPYVEMANQLASVLLYLSCQSNVNPGLMTALWRIWLDKVRFRTDVPGSPMERVAGTMALTGSKLDGADEESVKRVWNSYRTVVELEFGNEMDEEKEIRAIELVGRTIAGMVEGDLDNDGGKMIVKNLAKGFVPYTFDHTRFLDSYRQERSRLLSIQK